VSSATIVEETYFICPHCGEVNDCHVSDSGTTLECVLCEKEVDVC